MQIMISLCESFNIDANKAVCVGSHFFTLATVDNMPILVTTPDKGIVVIAVNLVKSSSSDFWLTLQLTPFNSYCMSPLRLSRMLLYILYSSNEK